MRNQLLKIGYIFFYSLSLTLEQIIFHLNVYCQALSDEALGRWHRSKETIQGFYPYGGWYGGKKWHDFDVGIKCKINNF